MAMLKTMSRKVGGCKQVKRYLEKDGRNVTFESSSWFLKEDNWDEVMDGTRQLFDKDTGRKYYHIIISPDPEDNLTAQQVASLAHEWVEQCYPGYQWIIETHIDNGVPHAHIVINSVNPVNGLKIHIDDDEVQQDAAALQILCREHRYSSFDNFKLTRDEDGLWYARAPRPDKRREIMLQAPREAKRHTTDGQRKARYSKAKLWTDRMHDDIEEQIQGCRTWQAFERNLTKIGYRININRRGVLTFYPPENMDAHPIKGYKLDDSYTVEGIEARLAVRLEGRRSNVELYDEHLIPSVKLPPKNFTEIVENTYTKTKRLTNSWTRITAVADALNIIRERKYTSYHEMKADADRLQAAATALDADADRLRLEAEQTDEALRQIEVYTSNRDQLTTRPTDPSGQQAWHKANAYLLDEMDKIERWMSERGLELNDGTYSDLKAKRSDISARAERVARQAREIKSDAQRMQNAVNALVDEPLSLGPTNVRQRSARQGKRLGGATLSVAQTKRLQKAYLERSSKMANLIQSGRLTPEGIKQIEADYEREKASIIELQRELDDQMSMSAAAQEETYEYEPLPQEYGEPVPVKQAEKPAPKVTPQPRRAKQVAKKNDKSESKEEKQRNAVAANAQPAAPVPTVPTVESKRRDDREEQRKRARQKEERQREQQQQTDGQQAVEEEAYIVPTVRRRH